MKNKIFQINIDTSVLRRLRDKVNENQNISYNKQYKKYRAWDKICAIMDRLDDTVDYLNQLKLNTGKYRRSAFDFYDFMNNSAVVCDCIKELAQIFDVDDEEIKTSSEIFNQTGTDGKGTDSNYFKYLRSLCSVHPIETSRHKRYQDNEFECSPYVTWNDNFIYVNDDCDIYAVVYTSKEGNSFKRVKIYISQIFEYIEKRVGFIEKIIYSIEDYQQRTIDDFRNEEIKCESEFDNYINYLKNLKFECEKRYGDDCFHSFDYIINLFQLELSNNENEYKMNLYKNAIKYAVKFEHNSIQNMSYEGFENNGLIDPPQNTETTLLTELVSPNSWSDEVRKYSYELGKISYLNDGSDISNIQWAYIQLKHIKPFLEKYVSFEKAKSDFEYYALVNLALYLECLENDCLINKNIPMDKNYRISI
ncbi:hypothetical protein [Intestinibacter bartlettii]|uniref:hypothetical protein n=1 Tax=Intestinibacter bartlettii TaxID=261299 RepID=UPI003522DA17